jgi:putative spermidine/putrescine transport system permease protein
MGLSEIRPGGSWGKADLILIRTRSRIFTTDAAVAITAAVALLPLLLLAVSSFAQQWFWPDLLPRNYSMRAWLYIASRGSGVATALFSSLLIATVVAAISVAVALPAARALAWYEFPGKRVFFFLMLLPVLAQPLASAMGVHALFLQLGLTETVMGVILVHLIPAVPYTTLMLTGSFTRFDPDWEAQARTLGASTLSVWRYVTLPAIAPGLAVAAGFAFLISWSQYLFTLLIGGGQVLTLPLILVSFQRGGDEALTAALALLFLVPTIAVFLLIARFLRTNE